MRKAGAAAAGKFRSGQRVFGRQTLERVSARPRSSLRRSTNRSRPPPAKVRRKCIARGHSSQPRPHFARMGRLVIESEPAYDCRSPLITDLLSSKPRATLTEPADLTPPNTHTHTHTSPPARRRRGAGAGGGGHLLGVCGGGRGGPVPDAREPLLRGTSPARRAARRVTRPGAALVGSPCGRAARPCGGRNPRACG